MKGSHWGLLLALIVSNSVWAGPFAARTQALDDPKSMEAVIAAGSAATPDLIDALKGPRPDLAIEALGRVGDSSCVPALVSLAKDSDPEIRAGVAWALGRSKNSGALATLIELCGDRYPAARIAAIGSLAALDSPEADAALALALASPDRDVRLAAAAAMGRNPRASMVPALSRLMEWTLESRKVRNPKPGTPETQDVVVWREPSDQVRLAAIRALAAAKVVDALPALITGLERETSFNRLQVIAAIDSMGEPAAGVCLGRIVPLPYEAEAFEKRMPLVVCNGTLAVIAGRLGDTRAIPYLLNTLKIPHKTLGEDKDLTELYIQTVEILGRFKVRKAARPLAELLKDARVRQLSDATQAALLEIGRPAARPLAMNLDDWRFAPVYLRLLREPELRTFAAREGILKFLGHESDEVRYEATQTLGLYLAEGILDEYDVPALEAMYLDHSRDVRASCAKWKAAVAKRYGEESKP